MVKFSGKGLAASLCCPCLSFLWGMIRLIYDLSWGADFGGKGIFRISYICAVLIGGLLSAILTLTLDIHTEYYLGIRILVIIGVFIFHSIVSRFVLGNSMVLLTMYMLVSAAGFIVQFKRVRDINTDAGESVILIISDPILYWTVYWLLLYLVN